MGPKVQWHAQVGLTTFHLWARDADSGITLLERSENLFLQLGGGLSVRLGAEERAATFSLSLSMFGRGTQVEEGLEFMSPMNNIAVSADFGWTF